MVFGRTLRTLLCGSIAGALLVVGASEAGAQSPDPGQTDCAPDGDAEFVCGPQNPEDLARIPGSPWVIVSTYLQDGSLSAAHAGDRTSVEIYPGEEPQARQDTDLYGDCPGPLAEDFWGHGVSLQPGDDGVHTLYVVRHGAREAVEVFELDATGEVPSVTWIGCVLPPPGGPEPPAHDFNSVVWLPEGGFAVTRFGGADEVWEWHPDGGWAAVPGSKGINPNGIEVSPDGRYFYIGGWATERLYRLSREAPYERDELWVGFHVDNVHFDESGRLLAAGQDATAEHVFDCALPDGVLATDNSRCTHIISRVVRVDQDLKVDEEIFRYRTNDHLPFGTVAIQVDDEVWIGGLLGNRIAVIDAPC